MFWIYLIYQSYDLFIFVSSLREACGIPAADWFTITGGMARSQPGDALRTVTRYRRTGEAETLPQLNVGRYHHACGSFRTDGGGNVRRNSNILIYLPYSYSSVTSQIT